MTAWVSARGLWFSLGDRRILDGIDLDFALGRMHGILGPNGCDKTTLIRALSGVLRPDAGEVRLDDAPIRAPFPAGLAWVMVVMWQGGQVSGDVTVRRLIGYGRCAYPSWWRPDPSGCGPAIEEVIAITGVVHLSHRLVAFLSGGERQRVRIATALAQQPRVLLLDEPTIYLDIAHQLNVLELTRDLNQRSGLTVITVPHDLAQAACCYDRCVVMGEGWVRTDGVPAEALSAGQIERSFAMNAWVTADPSAGHSVIAPRHQVSMVPLENRKTEGAP